MSNFSPPFYAEALSDLNPGDLTLGVPVHEGAVQIHTPFKVEMGRIAVSKGSNGIVIEADGGGPLQVEIITKQNELDSDGNRIYETTPVFTSPINKLELREMPPLDRTADVRSCWIAVGEGAQVTSRDALAKFAAVVGFFAYKKQQKEANN